MSTQPALRGKLRTILDCVLVFLLILVASANHLAAARDVLATEAMTMATSDQVGTNPGVDQPMVDNNALAGMIAAENAALTLPIHFVDLPLVTR